MARVEVRSRIPGPSGDPVPTVLVELASERTTVRDLIGRAVAEQIRVLAADRARCRRILDRQYMSTAELSAAAATGTVRMPSPREAADPDVADEVTRALAAFERGVFVVFVGGRQAERLDEAIVLRLGEPVVFLRLTALVGG